MIPIDIQVSRSKAKVKGNVGLPHLLQLINQERFAPKVSNLVGSDYLMIRSSLLISRCKGRVGFLHFV